MKKDLLKGRLRESMEAFEEAGDFCFLSNPTGEKDQAIAYMCPCGCGDSRSISIGATPDRGDNWGWDGDHEHPTITPSIRHLDGCKWHGFLQLGIWKTV